MPRWQDVVTRARAWAWPVAAGALLLALAAGQDWRAWTSIEGARRWFAADAPAEWSAVFIAAAIVHAALGGAGALAWLGGRGFPRGAALAGAALLVITPASLGVASWRPLFGVAWVPWALLAIDRWAARPIAARALAVGAALALVAADGSPGALIVALVVAVPVAAGAVLEEAPTPNDGDDRRRFLRAAAMTGAVALALVAIVGVGVAILVPAPPVASRLPLDRLSGFVLPRRGPGPYVTMLVLGASACVLALRRTPRVRALDIAALLGVVGTLAFTAEAFDATRVALAGLAAEGLAAIGTLDARARGRLTRALAIGAAAAGLAYGLGFVTDRTPWDKPAPLRDACAIGLASTWAAAWLLYALAAAGDAARRAALAFVAALIVMIDLWFAQAPAIERTWRAVPKPPPAAAVTSPR